MVNLFGQFNSAYRLFAVLLLALTLSGCATVTTPNFEPASPHLRVVTYNINWGSAGSDEIAKYLAEETADLVFLQETHPHWETFLRKRLNATFPYQSYHHSPGAGGIAFLAKRPLNNVRSAQASQGWFPALLADAETPLGSVQLLNVHLKPPLSPRGHPNPKDLIQAAAIHREEIRTYLKTELKPGRPTLVAGDFNENEHKGGVKLLRESGFSNALSNFDRTSKTWRWRVAPGVRLSGRYDHILHSPEFICTGAGVRAGWASDHRPVLAVLKHR